jgi:hypothetical protein
MRTLKTKAAALAVALALGNCLCLVSSSYASTAETNRTAYGFAMKCFVANGVARGNNRDVGNNAQADAYEQRARESYDVASKLGSALGYEHNRVAQDFGMAQTEELPKLVKDREYLKQTTATCEAAGL